MFSLFRKKPQPAAAVPPPDELEPDVAPLADELEGSPAPPPPVEEEEPLLTWEELDALEGRAAPVKKAAPVAEVEKPGPAASVPAPAPAPVAPLEPERTPLERALDRCEADPHDANLVHDAARLAYAAKTPEAAVKPLLRTATLLAQSDPETALDLLTRLANMGQGSKQSTEVMLEICRYHPHSPSSEHAVRGVLRAEPERLDALAILSDMQLASRRYPDAIATLNQISALDPADAAACEKRGDAYALLGDTERALESWSTAADRFEQAGVAEEAQRLRDQVSTLRAAAGATPA